MRHYSKVSAIGALTVLAKRKHLSAYLHLYSGVDICREAAVAFLRELLCHLRGVVVLIWDRWNVHRGKTVRGFLERHPRLQVEYFPPYAPKLKPQEQCWTLLKYHRLGNHGIAELDVLEEAVGMEFCSICSEQLLAVFFSGIPITYILITLAPDIRNTDLNSCERKWYIPSGGVVCKLARKIE